MCLRRVIALSFVLRTGVSCSYQSQFRTVQARIDTILYRRLCSAESTLFKMMQKIVWASAGRLKREQLYPVALAMWQLMRLMCLRASHLASLKRRSKGSFLFPLLVMTILNATRGRTCSITDCGVCGASKSHVQSLSVSEHGSVSIGLPFTPRFFEALESRLARW